MIEERKKLLEKYFNILVNDPFSRGSKQVRKFISFLKGGIK